MQTRSTRSARQGGAALLILLVIVIIAATGVLLNSLNRASVATERDRITAEALAQAKEALIAHAVSVNLTGTGPRPGDLPCPDITNDGVADTPCDDQVELIGRLPWRTLKIDDLRDGSGERLWYAVSINFKNSPRTTCTAAITTGCINSDARGTITLFDAALNTIHNGVNPDTHTPSGAIALIIAPGAALVRADSSTTQNRINNAIQGLATDTQNIATNYLDRYSANGEDNADFVDSSDTNGFINGPIKDVVGNVLVNDRVLAITYQDMMPRLEKRVAAEVLNCLTTYAAANYQRYPWTAQFSADFNDEVNKLFGRVPDTPFDDTYSSTGNRNDSDAWTIECNIPIGHVSNSTDWWRNWKYHVLYAIGSTYRPTNSTTPPAANTCDIGGNCLVVNPSTAADKRVAVMVAGKRLVGVSGGQPRNTNAERQTLTNYLESPNSANTNNEISGTFSKATAISTFNDVLVYQ